MITTCVAVLRGGPSTEYEASLRTGSAVLIALKEIGYSVQDIIVSKRGEWLVNGLVKTPENVLLTTDVAFIAMHGTYAEDGIIQNILERYHIPFTGSGSFSSRLAFNKDTTKRTLRELNIKLPRHIRITRDNVVDIPQLAVAISKSFGPPYILKPTLSSFSRGVIVLNSSDSLAKTLQNALEQYDQCMIEEYIFGVEATCGVLEQFRGERYYTLPPTEIILRTEHDHYSTTLKRGTEIVDMCPGRFSFSEREQLSTAALTVHKTLGLSQYSRSDFIVHNGNIYFLEVNTLPDFTEKGLFSKAADAVGLSYNTLIDHLVKTAMV